MRAHVIDLFISGVLVIVWGCAVVVCSAALERLAGWAYFIRRKIAARRAQRRGAPPPVPPARRRREPDHPALRHWWEIGNS